MSEVEVVCLQLDYCINNIDALKLAADNILLCSFEHLGALNGKNSVNEVHRLHDKRYNAV